MKKLDVLLLMIILLNVFAGCQKDGAQINTKKADDISIFYGVNSYAMFGADENTIKTLSQCFDNLSFEATDKQMDMLTMLSVNFYRGEKRITQVCVDKKGVFWLNGDTECLEIASGDFNYAVVKNIYRKSSLENGPSHIMQIESEPKWEFKLN